MHTVGEDATQSSSDFSHQMVMLTSWYVCGFGQRSWCNAMGAQRLYGRGMPRPEAEVTTALNKLHLLMGAQLLYGRGMPRPIAEVNYSTDKVAFTNGSRHAATVQHQRFP